MLMVQLAGAAALIGSLAAAPAADVRLTGAGATFPQPLYERWVVEYQKTHSDVKIEYGGGGSGAGIKSITDKTVAFAGSDAPMSAKEIEAAGGTNMVIEFPSCAGAVVPAYNVPGVTKDLNFTPELIAEIFMGKVSNWSDPKIAAVNKDVKLPDLAITPAWRTDGSGTTFVFTSYLAGEVPDFKSSIGKGKQVQFKIGQGGKGNPGVAAIIQQTAGAIGYVELNYATENKLAFGAVKNKAGKFVKASDKGVAAAGEASSKELKGNQLTADIWSQTGDEAYPISAFTYLIVYKDLNNVKTSDEATALVNFLWWATQGEGQKLCKDLGYAPLAKSVQQKVATALEGLTYKGATISIAKK